MTARVLGYGGLLDPAWIVELVGREHVRATRTGRLLGFRRHWNVVYRDEEVAGLADGMGEPYSGGVAYLGLREAPGSEFPVREFEVDDAGLAILDEDESRYRRVDARDRYECDGEPGPPGPVWLWIDAPGAAPEPGETVVVIRAYLETVRSAAARIAPDGAAAFDATTDACPWPVRDLTRRE